eukprot:EG_transcript_22883
MADHHAWVAMQEDRFHDLLEKIRFLAAFDKYDLRTATFSKGKLIKSKLPRVDFEARLDSVLVVLREMERNPVNLFMLSQYISRKFPLEQQREWMGQLRTTKKTLLTSDGEEPEHVPHIIRREFYLMDLVMSGLSLRDWRRILGCESTDGPIQGIAFEDDGARVVDVAASATTATVIGSLPPRPSAPVQPPDPDLLSNASVCLEPDDDTDLADPFVYFDDLATPGILTPANTSPLNTRRDLAVPAAALAASPRPAAGSPRHHQPHQPPSAPGPTAS